MNRIVFALRVRGQCASGEPQKNVKKTGNRLVIFGFCTIIPLIIHSNGTVAQWLEQVTHNLLVAGSNPAGSTIIIKHL